MNRKMPLKNALILLTAATIWGTAFVAQSVGMDYMGPFTFNGLRYYLGALVLVPAIVLRRAAKRRTIEGGAEHPEGTAQESPGPSMKWILAGGCLCGFFLCVASNLQQFAIISVDVGKAGFLTAMYIVIVPVLAFFVTRRTSLRLWISVALACAGLYFLSISGGMRLETGDLALIGCAAVFSLHIMCRCQNPDRTSAPSDPAG